MPRPSSIPPSARGRAADVLAAAVAQFPDLEPAAPDTAGIDPRDARLAVAIHRTVLQRWITLEHMLDRHLRRPVHRLEPSAAAVLLSAAAQLLFMDRLPAHAVIDESVELAKHMVRPGAAGLVNAVLRRLAEQVAGVARGEPWTPAPDRLPIDDGYVHLREAALPEPAKLEEYLSVAAGTPMPLVRRWFEQFGPERATAIAVHGVMTPPTIVAVEPQFTPPPVEGATLPGAPGAPGVPGAMEAHEQPGFFIWHDTHERLLRFLEGHPWRRVQDPGAAAALRLLDEDPPSQGALAVDFCAGRGTKTRQLAAMRPDMQVLATDPDAHRLRDLRQGAAPFPNIKVFDAGKLAAQLEKRKADLLILDVPCSNTAVLARRPEARYRFGEASLGSVIQLQRRIMAAAMPLLAPRGVLLYSTCSLERQENQDQVEWLRREHGLAVVRERLTLPAGAGRAFHDGGYAVLLTRPTTAPAGKPAP